MPDVAAEMIKIARADPVEYPNYDTFIDNQFTLREVLGPNAVAGPQRYGKLCIQPDRMLWHNAKCRIFRRLIPSLNALEIDAIQPRSPRLEGTFSASRGLNHDEPTVNTSDFF